MPLSKFSRAEKNRIVEEYLHTSKSQKEIAKKYGVLESTFSVWVSRYSSTRRTIVSLQRELKRYGTMKDMTKDEELVALRKALKEKERELAEANLKVEALNVLIDLAEEHGMPVRKNSAAKR